MMITEKMPDAAAARCNCLAIRQAAREVTKFYDRHLAATGLRATQFAVLARLARHGPCSINVLASLMVLDRTSLGRAVRPLEREGLVRMTPGPDRRIRLLALTESGARRLATGLPKWQEAQDAFEAAFGGPESAALRALMASVVTILGADAAPRHP